MVGAPSPTRSPGRASSSWCTTSFLWGSRGLPAETLAETERRLAPALAPLTRRPDTTEASALYNAGAALQEHILAKYCTLLGTSMAALICHEDRIATAYLRSRGDVVSARIGCIGLSGGGCRAALLLACDDAVAAAVIVGMMSTYAGLLDRHVAPHSWMVFPPGLSRVADWPELAACRAPTPLMVQYALADELFTVDGMRAADARIGATYERAGAPGNYRGEFHPGPHRFDRAMQAAAFDWLRGHLAKEFWSMSGEELRVVLGEQRYRVERPWGRLPADVTPGLISQLAVDFAGRGLRLPAGRAAGAGVRAVGRLPRRPLRRPHRRPPRHRDHRRRPPAPGRSRRPSGADRDHRGRGARQRSASATGRAGTRPSTTRPMRRSPPTARSTSPTAMATRRSIASPPTAVT